MVSSRWWGNATTRTSLWPVKSVTEGSASQKSTRCSVASGDSESGQGRGVRHKSAPESSRHAADVGDGPKVHRGGGGVDGDLDESGPSEEKFPRVVALALGDRGRRIRRPRALWPLGSTRPLVVLS